MSTHRTRPLLGPYARSHVWAPPFRNSGSAPEQCLNVKALNVFKYFI